MNESPILLGQVWRSRAAVTSALEVIGVGPDDHWYVVVIRHDEPTALALIPASRLLAGYLLAVDA